MIVNAFVQVQPGRPPEDGGEIDSSSLSGLHRLPLYVFAISSVFEKAVAS